MSVCLRDYIGGDVFTLNDITGGGATHIEVESSRQSHSPDMTGM